MVAIAKMLCIKNYEITAQNGDYFKAEQGEVYTTSFPDEDRDTVVVFSNFWVPIPKDHFVLTEKQPSGWGRSQEAKT